MPQDASGSALRSGIPVGSSFEELIRLWIEVSSAPPSLRLFSTLSSADTEPGLTLSHFIVFSPYKPALTVISDRNDQPLICLEGRRSCKMSRAQGVPPSREFHLFLSDDDQDLVRENLAQQTSRTCSLPGGEEGRLGLCELNVPRTTFRRPLHVLRWDEASGSRRFFGAKISKEEHELLCEDSVSSIFLSGRANRRKAGREEGRGKLDGL